MTLQTVLRIRPGITAVIGSGGKSTLLRSLGEELAGSGHRVILCTTTKIYPFPDLPNLTDPQEDSLRSALSNQPLLCVGSPLPGTGKLSAPALSMESLSQLADYVLVEADGAAGLPMKAHAPHEPVIPPEANQTICIVGASGFWHSVAQAVHRPELFAKLAGLSLNAPVTPEAVATVLRAEHLHHRVYVNQADSPQTLAAGKKLQSLLPCPVTVGALLHEGSKVLCW